MHILLIDDNHFFTTTFAGLLKRAGYRVSISTTSGDAKRLHSQDPADLVIWSFYLKERDGRSYLEDLQESFADTRVIGLFCQGDKSELLYPLLVKQVGKERVFTKPFRTEEVLDTIYAELAPPAREACW